MANGPALVMTPGGRRATVAVDASFALSPLGLLSVMTLAGVADVYVPRSLLGPLDNNAAISRNPAGLASPVWGYSRAELAAMAEALGLWRRAWHFGRLANRVHWIGDVTFESMPADRDDSGLRTRFEWCAAAFETSFGDHFDLAFPLDTCARDALALAAATLPDPVIVLTAGDEQGSSKLCDLLADAGVAMQSACFDTGLAGRTWLGSSALRAANAVLVEVLVPGAMALPEGWSAEQDWEGEVEALIAWDIWSGARLLVHGCHESGNGAALPLAKDRAA